MKRAGNKMQVQQTAVNFVYGPVWNHSQDYYEVDRRTQEVGINTSLSLNRTKARFVAHLLPSSSVALVLISSLGFTSFSVYISMLVTLTCLHLHTWAKFIHLSASETPSKHGVSLCACFVAGILPQMLLNLSLNKINEY